MPTRIKTRRDTAARWSSINPILADGEFGIERDTGFLKIGDGATRWNVLPYLNSGGGGGTPADVLRTSTTGVVVYQENDSLVGGAFVVPGYYRKTASGWDFPPHLQEATFERFAITAFPYTPTLADIRNGMIFLQPAADAVVTLPANLYVPPANPTGLRMHMDIVFYVANPVVVTFTPGTGVQLLRAGSTASQPNFQVTGPIRAVLMQTRGTSYRVLE